MKITLTYEGILELNSGIEKCKNLEGQHFTYCINKNQRLLENDLKTLEENRKQVAEFTKFLEENRAIHNEHVEKTESGEEVKVKDSYGNEVPKYKNEKAMKTKIAAAREKYADAIREQRKKERKYQLFLQDEAEIDIFPYIHDLPREEDDEETGGKSGANIRLFQVDGILPLLQPKSVSEANKPKKGTMTISHKKTTPKKAAEKLVEEPVDDGLVEIEFTRLAILEYKRMFSEIMLVDSPAFVDIFIENLRILKTMQAEFQKTQQYKDYYNNYDYDKSQLLKEYSMKNLFGDSLSKDLGYGKMRFILAEENEYNKQLKKLDEKYQTTIEAYNDFANELIKVRMHPVPYSILWHNISGKQMEQLFDFIDHEK